MSIPGQPTAAPSLSTAAITDFQNEVIQDYQKNVSRLRGLVRRRSWERGQQTRFQLYGKGSVGEKSASQIRVQPINPAHAYKDVAVKDVWGSSYVDDLEQLLAQGDDRTAVQTSLTSAFAREADDRILTAMDGTTKEIDHHASAMGQDVFEKLFQHFGEQTVEESDRYFATDQSGWVDWLQIPQFANRDYVPEGQLPFGGDAGPWTMGKMFYGFLGFYMNGLQATANPYTKNFAWQKQRVGYGVVKELSLEWSRENDMQSWLVVGTTKHGADLLPQADTGTVIGVVRVLSTTTVTGL